LLDGRPGSPRVHALRVDVCALPAAHLLKLKEGARAEGNYDAKQLSSKVPLLVTVAVNFPTRRITGEPPQLNTLIPGERAVSVQKISTLAGLDVQDVATQQLAPVVYGFSHCVSP
jgi:hypothetical protein